MLPYASDSVIKLRSAPLSAIAAAVQVATLIKRQFALKPAINRMRRERAEQRKIFTDQIDNMY